MVRPASRVAEPAPASPELVTEEPSGEGAIGGWVVWADGQPTDRVKLVLKGAPETPLAHLQWVARTDAAGRNRCSDTHGSDSSPRPRSRPSSCRRGTT